MAAISATFDQQAGLYRPSLLYPDWGARWRTAKSHLAKDGLVRIAILGDSISAGEIATNWLTDGYVAHLRDTLQARYGDGGSGYITHNYRTLGNPGGGQVTTTGAWTDVDNEGGILRRSLKPTVSGNGATITMPVRGTTLDLWFRTDPAFGQFHYQIDGGSFVAVPLTAAASILQVTTTMSAGSHTIVVRATTGDGRFYGVRGRNASGIIVENMSLSQTALADMANATSGVTASDPYDNMVAMRTLTAVGPCDVVILALGANDVGVDVDDTVFLSNMWNAIAAVQYAAARNGRTILSPPDLIVVGEHIGKGDIVPGFSLYERDYMQLHSVLREAAKAMNAAFVDLWSAGGNSWDYWASLGYWGNNNTDVVHPNDVGHRVYASFLIDLLMA